MVVVSGVDIFTTVTCRKSGVEPTLRCLHLFARDNFEDSGISTQQTEKILVHLNKGTWGKMVTCTIGKLTRLNELFQMIEQHEIQLFKHTVNFS